jgi:hypothetical protein
MPLKLENASNWIYPTNQWSVLKTGKPLADIKIDRNFYINVKY